MFNFKVKALLAASLLAVALPASAAMTTSGSGASSLILTVFDMNTGGKTATFDLGFDKNSFLSNQNLTAIDLTTGDYATAWNAFTAGSTMTNVQYAIFAGDYSGTTNTDYSYFTTAGGASMASLFNSSFNTQLGNLDTYIGNVNNLTNHNTVANGGSISASGAAGYARVSTFYGTSNGKIGTFGGDATGSLGTNLNVWNIAGVEGGAGGSITPVKLEVNGFNPFFNLSSSGVLNYTAVAAVPEADTSLMMLAGMGLMGLIARRRKSV